MALDNAKLSDGIVIGDYKIKLIDARNYRLYQHREVKGRWGDNTLTWVPRNAYFQDLEQALCNLYEIMAKDKAKHVDEMAGYVEEVKAIKREIIQAVNEAKE